MSVMKENGTKRLIDQILASMRVGKIAIMDKALNINSKNPVENGVITQAINGINNALDSKANVRTIYLGRETISVGDTATLSVSVPIEDDEDIAVVGFRAGATGSALYTTPYIVVEEDGQKITYPYVKQRTYTHNEQKLTKIDLGIYNFYDTETQFDAYVTIQTYKEEA